jgi:hypothetical protein
VVLKRALLLLLNFSLAIMFLTCDTSQVSQMAQVDAVSSHLFPLSRDDLNVFRCVLGYLLGSHVARAQSVTLSGPHGIYRVGI